MLTSFLASALHVPYWSVFKVVLLGVLVFNAIVFAALAIIIWHESTVDIDEDNEVNWP